MKNIYALVVSIISLSVQVYSQNNTPWNITGNIGIGTTSPSNQLDVIGKIGVSNGITMTGVPTNTSDINYIQATNSSSTVGLLAGTGVFSAISGPYLGGRGNTYNALSGQRGLLFLCAGAVSSPTGNEGSIIFQTTSGPGTNESIRMMVARDGNVGIGTTNPQAKLAVNGDIFSKKVKVTQTGWPDYVFHASYKLRPLTEVEQYIQQYHHLPEVPSTEEVEKNGLDLGNNQAMLLKKIEELTLYVIEQNKWLGEQAKQLEQQQLAIDSLKKQVGQSR